jgi:signal peptidase I
MTAVAFPMVHDTIPVVKSKSYLNFPQLPYFRFPGFQSIKRNDIVVFNWPVDTVRYFRDQSKIHIDKPIDKKSNYVKRAVGIAGDTLSLVDGYVYINGKKETQNNRAKLQFSYILDTKGQSFGRGFFEDYNITDGAYRTGEKQVTIVALTETDAKRMESHPNIEKVTREIAKPGVKEGGIFPNNGKVDWNRDQMGPVYIPRAGDKIKIDSTNFSIYGRTISEYEGNTIDFKSGHVYINGSSDADPVYTFKQDYYWMMGDNRHNSEDSRYWGFVPFDHVVGKPVFVWMSIDGINDGIKNWKFRWNRFFTTVGGEGEPVSYFKYFLIFIGGWYVFSIFLKRRKKA